MLKSGPVMYLVRGNLRYSFSPSSSSSGVEVAFFTLGRITLVQPSKRHRYEWAPKPRSEFTSLRRPLSVVLQIDLVNGFDYRPFEKTKHLGRRTFLLGRHLGRNTAPRRGSLLMPRASVMMLHPRGALELGFDEGKCSMFSIEFFTTSSFSASGSLKGKYAHGQLDENSGRKLLLVSLHSYPISYKNSIEEGEHILPSCQTRMLITMMRIIVAFHTLSLQVACNFPIM